MCQPAEHHQFSQVLIADHRWSRKLINYLVVTVIIISNDNNISNNNSNNNISNNNNNNNKFIKLIFDQHFPSENVVSSSTSSQVSEDGEETPSSHKTSVETQTQDFPEPEAPAEVKTLSFSPARTQEQDNLKKARKFFTSQTRPRSETSRSNESSSHFVSSPALNSGSSFTSSLASSVLTSSIITSTDKPGLRILLKQKKKKPKAGERFEICSDDSVPPKIKFKVCRSGSEPSKNLLALPPVTGIFKTPESRVNATTQSANSQQLSVATAKSPLAAPTATTPGQSTTSSMLLTSVLASSGPPSKQGRNILSHCLSRKRPHVESTLPMAVSGRPPTSCTVARTTDSTSSTSAASAVDVGASFDLSASVSKRSCDERYKEFFNQESMEAKRRLLLEGKGTTTEEILGLDALEKFKGSKPKVDYNSNRISAKNLNIRG